MSLIDATMGIERHGGGWRRRKMSSKSGFKMADLGILFQWVANPFWI